MSLTRAEVEHIARLARLELTEEELSRFSEQLSSILDYAARLREIDTSTIPPTASVLDTGLPLREDIPAPSLDVTAVLRNAPQVEDHQFRVPPVLE
ncbi:aspartyl/glutamyl-tRNA(Asn/Gln) amidotransferase subunit C [Anaerolinea thermolimosa]|uniref:Aspartyl/glutamyl-tRNA(Asn/Gln) amidotransferase subunit C n=1 Tax=Anaerolinea thermolimosa TaxID=229919 RepID=A0A7U9KN38_9CHLR|nr:Asp-tRNA(Asn)/Glu-tRNA(Gln) amidotransferase subunit GatC [Anaerolinea thermolimosa]GAP08243.1 aspartyl/glutamyl-tRNA(Asn/Gln) amidotransferase subunit C [Anaerolinea thermolimosa]